MSQLSPNTVAGTTRAFDYIYIAFLAFHGLCAVLIDLQNYLPQDWFPTAVVQVYANYQRDSGDPLASHAWQAQNPWFAFLLVKEIIVDIPTILIGIYSLLRDRKTAYPLLLVYASTTLIATGAAMATVTIGTERVALSDKQWHTLVFKAYAPFVVIPAIMLYDLTWRTVTLIQTATRRSVASSQEVQAHSASKTGAASGKRRKAL